MKSCVGWLTLMKWYLNFRPVTYTRNMLIYTKLVSLLWCYWPLPSSSLVPVRHFPVPLGQFTSVTCPRWTGGKHIFAWTAWPETLWLRGITRPSDQAKLVISSRNWWCRRCTLEWWWRHWLLDIDGWFIALCEYREHTREMAWKSKQDGNTIKSVFSFTR